jgi:hypothetical protein
MTLDNGTHWRDMLNQQGRGARQMGGESSPSALPPSPLTPTQGEREVDDDLMLDMAEYRPWVLQRGRSRPAALLDLRWYDTRAGLWLGCAMAYPQLAAAEYIGDRMVSLDFGKRQFILEGEGLAELVRRIQDGSVIRIQEYAAAVWPHRPVGAVIKSIKRVGKDTDTIPNS